MRRRPFHLLAVLVVAAGFSFAQPALARADDEPPSGVNAAIAINTKDGSSVFKLAFAIRHVMSGVVDQTNVAFAQASCTQCTTIAIAIEIVLVEAPAPVFTPVNAAVAINQQCTLCVTVAQAYQFVTTPVQPGPVEFDEEGAQILRQIRHELHKLKDENLTPDELQVRLNAIAARIQDVLAHHLVPAEREEEHGSSGNGPPPGQTTTGTTPTTTTTTTPTSTTTPTTTETGTTSTPTTTAATTTTTP